MAESSVIFSLKTSVEKGEYHNSFPQPILQKIMAWLSNQIVLSLIRLDVYSCKQISCQGSGLNLSSQLPTFATCFRLVLETSRFLMIHSLGGRLISISFVLLDFWPTFLFLKRSESRSCYLAVRKRSSWAMSTISRHIASLRSI